MDGRQFIESPPSRTEGVLAPPTVLPSTGGIIRHSNDPTGLTGQGGRERRVIWNYGAICLLRNADGNAKRIGGIRRHPHASARTWRRIRKKQRKRLSQSLEEIMGTTAV